MFVGNQITINLVHSALSVFKKDLRMRIIHRTDFCSCIYMYASVTVKYVICMLTYNICLVDTNEEFLMLYILILFRPFNIVVTVIFSALRNKVAVRALVIVDEN